jgi:acetylornithine deacetylase/succinyl-diaminopimelate desuccinylase-like protein
VRAIADRLADRTIDVGPGDPQYAHGDDGRIEIAPLHRSVEVLRAVLEGAGKG